jgi:tetratricopeptide (TPR) repeat protein
MYELAGKYNQAAKYISKAAKLDENNADVWYAYAEVQFKLGFIEDGCLAFEKSIELDPDNADIWLDYSNLLFDNGLTEEAVSVISDALFQHPDNADLHYRLTAYLLSTGAESEAQQSLCNALSIDYNKHNQLFDFLPHSKNSRMVLDVISSYKS